MNVGVPREVKEDEHRVALTPAAARELIELEHRVLVEAGAGLGCAMSDDAYACQGAQIVPHAEELFAESELILKVKEPRPAEVARLERHHTLFTFLHLAAAPSLAEALMNSGATCIAYETVEDRAGRLPLLAPMSEVAGKLAAQFGASLLTTTTGGPGILVGGVPGVQGATVMILGGGVVGRNAALVALGLGASVYVLDRDLDRLRELGKELGGRGHTCYASTVAIREMLPFADLVIGAVLVPGARAPRVLRRTDLGLMKRGAVLIDVSIDQGGCFETSHPTTHSDPTYQTDGIVHCCVANLPGAVPVTSTHALANATFPYVRKLVTEGVPAALASDPGFLSGLNVVAGKVVQSSVALDLGIDPVEPHDALAALSRRKDGGRSARQPEQSTH
jgi:alanine dehydrogenase